MAQRRRRKTSILSTILVELGALLGIVTVAQPNWTKLAFDTLAPAIRQTVDKTVMTSIPQNVSAQPVQAEATRQLPWNSGAGLQGFNNQSYANPSPGAQGVANPWSSAGTDYPATRESAGDWPLRAVTFVTPRRAAVEHMQW